MEGNLQELLTEGVIGLLLPNVLSSFLQPVIVGLPRYNKVSIEST